MYSSLAFDSADFASSRPLDMRSTKSLTEVNFNRGSRGSKPIHVRGLPVSPVPPHSLLSFPITSYFFAIISNLLRCLPTSRDLSQTIATIADHRRRPHSLTRHRPALSQRPSKYGRLGTIHGHLYTHIPHC